MKLLLIIVVLVPISVFSQTDSKVIDRWSRSVFCFETRPLPYSLFKLTSKAESIRSRCPELADSIMKLEIESTMHTNTGIYLKYNKRYYLLTARHCLTTPIFGDSNFLSRYIIPIEDMKLKPDSLVLINERNPYILKVSIPALDGVGYDSLPYVFSNYDDDIGILSLNERHSKPLRLWLDQNQYSPITIADIDTTNMGVSGDPVFIMGFPEESCIKVKNTNWAAQSDYISILSVTKGMLKENDTRKNFYDVVSPTWHGYSGGPLIRNGKLIAIVSGPTDGVTPVRGNGKPYIVQEVGFKRAALIPKYLRELEKKLDKLGQFLPQ